MTVAALYVDPLAGPYPRLSGVDVWGWADLRQTSFLDRDATAYDGPHPVVAHPPCGAWGLFAWNYKAGPAAKACGPLAVEQVRQWGGVLEHPAGSQLWKHCGLPKPGAPPDDHDGWTLAVEQVDWGHPCHKPTWLYIVGTDTVPPLPKNLNGPTHCMVRLRRNSHDRPKIPDKLRHITPPTFAWWLVSVARRTRQEEP